MSIDRKKYEYQDNDDVKDFFAHYNIDAKKFFNEVVLLCIAKGDRRQEHEKMIQWFFKEHPIILMYTKNDFIGIETLTVSRTWYNGRIEEAIQLVLRNDTLKHVKSHEKRDEKFYNPVVQFWNEIR